MQPFTQFSSRYAMIFNFLTLSLVNIVEVLGFSLLLSDVPDKYQELVGNICVCIVILVSCYLKIHPNERASFITEFLTIILACVVSMPMMKNDSSFLNVFNILCAFGVIFYMAYCTSRKWLDDNYQRFCDYVNKESDDSYKESVSYDKVLRSKTEITKRYIHRVDSKIPEIENYVNYFMIPIDNEKDYKKILDNYYNLYRFYVAKGFYFKLVKEKKNVHAIKISWAII